MKLLVIILNYRVTQLTLDCLHSLVPEVHRVPGTTVAVCENGTGGDAVERLSTAITDNGWSSWVELTAISPNRGFTGGNNLIIRQALTSGDPPEYFLLLNADTLVLPGAFAKLVAFMDAHPAVGIAGSRLECPDCSHQSSPFRFLGIASELDRGLQLGIVSRLLAPYAVSMVPPATASRVDWVSGASMIIRRTVVDAIGPLDDGLYTYFDDIDFCLNAKRAGWETWYVPQSRVVHLEGASTGIVAGSQKRRPAYWYQARRRFLVKNHAALYAALADLAFLVGFTLWQIRRRLQGKPDTNPPGMLVDAFRNSVFLTGFEIRDVENPAIPRI
jgi:N-acetylglucosaminyl-diphospho-decaprenol L-rhamnosyltransferase